MYSYRFQLKGGTWVFVPSEEGLAAGRQVLRRVLKAWTPPSTYFHLRKGGHLAALELHEPDEVFVRLDLSQFFTNTSRSKVTAALKRVRFSAKDALSMADLSTVKHPDAETSKVVPYGFVQSALLATLCLEYSHLGACIRRLRTRGLRVSVYMDDIIMSGQRNQKEALELGLAEIIAASKKSRYPINRDKLEGPSDNVVAFNIHLSNRSRAITDARLHDFSVSLRNARNQHVERGILSYVGTVNPSQVKQLVSEAIVE